MNDPQFSAERRVPRAVVCLVIVTVLVSFLNSVLLCVFFDVTAAKIIQRSGRFALTCGLAYALYRGMGWARWVTIVLTGLAFLTSMLGALAMPASVALAFRVWFILLGLSYGAVAVALLLVPAVVRHFKRTEPPPLHPDRW